MPIFSDEDKKLIRDEYFDRMKSNVEIYFFWSEDERSRYKDVIRELLKELGDITDKITITDLKFEEAKEEASKFNVSYAPCIVLFGEAGEVKYYGVPAGQEFPSFLKAIVMVSTGEVELDEYLEELLRKINKKIKIKIFITLTCPYCPLMTETAYKFALKSKNIDVEVIEAEEFVDEVRKYEIYAVPKTIINEEISFEGLIPPEVFAAYIEKAVKMEGA